MLNIVLLALLLGHEEFRYPVTGMLGSSYWTPRWYGPHGALDIHAPLWRDIYAARRGSVIFSGWYGPYGQLVQVSHGAGYVTWYAHMIKLGASKGDTVKTGGKIGDVGSTGNSSLPHLHFEIRRWNTKVYIPPNTWGAPITAGKFIPYHYAGLAPLSQWDVVKVTASANMRSSPGGAIIGAAAAGQRYVKIGQDGWWIKVRYGDTAAWIGKGNIDLIDAPVVRVKWPQLNVRTGPGTSYASVGTVEQNQKFAHLGASNGWVKICFEGHARWINGNGVQRYDP